MRLILFILLCLSLFSCKTGTVYIPVESVKTEYRDRVMRDSVHLYDSVLLKIKEDTVYLEKYKYLYRDRQRTDTVIKTDSIRIPYPVKEIKAVNVLTLWQKLRIWIGNFVLFTLLAGGVFLILKWKWKLR